MDSSQFPRLDRAREKFAMANQTIGAMAIQDDMTASSDGRSRLGRPDRLGAFGWSYGGYMTMWIDTQTDRFKAIPPVPVCQSLFITRRPTFTATYQPSSTPKLRGQYQEYGITPQRNHQQRQDSTMILHGQADTASHSRKHEEFYRALLERHVPVEYVTTLAKSRLRRTRHPQDRWQRYLVFFGIT